MADVELNLDYYEGGSFQGTPKDYIARMARNSVISIQGASQGADTIYEGLSTLDEDGKMWLPSYLRKEFDRTNIEENYIKFNRRLLHASLKRFLIMQMIVSVAAIIFLLAINTDYLLRSLPDVIVQVVLFILSFVLFLIVFREQFTQRLPYFYTIVAVVIPLVLLGLDIGLQSFYVFSADNGTHLPWAFYVISAIYSFMPIQKDWVVILVGGITSIVYLLFSGLIIYTNDEVNMLKRLFADGVYYFCINCLGIMSRFLSEIVLRRSFADRRSCVESRFKLDYEKEQEEKLLLTIIPKHIAKEVSEDLREAIADVTIGDDSDFEDETNERDALKKKNMKTSPFSRQASQSDKLAPYSNEYELVSILFADIVNFTPLTTTLKVKDLVAMLNDLFAKFDEAAERNNCLRIKILGDCYYCVSGIPEPTADHAINCVKMGLDMIGVIAGVRTETGVDVDMRIGVHSGRVISGLLGIRKWQFDVWSTDTTIANKMEQSGRPGRVHVTEQTLGHLRGNFDYEPSDGADKEPYLKERNIQTYLIIADPQTDKFIKEVLEAPPTITLLTTELEKRISNDFEKGDCDESEGYSDDSSESGFEEEKELTEKRLRKHYRVFPLEYIQGETEFKDIDTFGTDSISIGYDSSLQLSSSLSSQMSPENLPTMPQNKPGNRLYEKKVNATGGVGKKIFDRSNSVVPRRRSTATNNDPNTPVGRDRRTASSTKSLTDYSHLRARADEYMRNVIDTMPISESTKSGSRQLDNRTLMFRNRRWEKSYMLQPDPLFKYYHLCVIFILICIMVIQVVIAAYTSFYFWVIFGIGMILLLSVIPFTFIGQIWMTLKDPKKEADFISPPQREQPIAQFLYNNGKEIVKSFTIRMIIFVCATAVVSLLAILMIVECPKISSEAPSQYNDSSSYLCESDRRCMHLLCYYPWYFTYSFALALAALNIFVRMHFLVKLILYLVYFALYSVTIMELRKDIFQPTTINDRDLYTGSPALSSYPGLPHVIYLAVVVVILHVIDRKEEFVHRLDYVLKKQLKKEQIMANQTRLVNKILLQNILPEHVAREYLSESHSEDQLYHETHSSVAVMFASIPSFADFWELNGEQDMYNNGIGALKVLNSIVAEFDGLLFDPRFSCIEKIKVIGSTYMAACGLSHSGTSGRKGAIMVDFVREMAKKLREVSSEAVHTMDIRVGIECGPLIAGVVGKTKPLYDIWGDTVNMASRMDYTGEAGKIHVTEATAKILMQEGISCDKRGITYVKGKGEIITYWISLNDHSNLTMTLPIIEETEDNHYYEDSSDHETEL